MNEKEALEVVIKKLAETKPIPRIVECHGPNGAHAWAGNPEYPPRKAGECECEDYAMFVYKDVMPIVLRMYQDACLMRSEISRVGLHESLGYTDRFLEKVMRYPEPVIPI